MSELFPLGVVLAIGAGSAINIGIVIQKKAVNEIPPEKRDEKFFRSLVRRRTWLLGLLVQIAIGTTLTVISQLFIGPALLPGLLAVGLVPMAIGAAKIVGESLKAKEVVAIALIIVAAVLLTLSDIGVDTLGTSIFQEPAFWLREWVFTGIFFAIIIVAEIFQRNNAKIRSIALAIEAGCFLAMANYWLSPVTVHIKNLGTGTLVMPWELVVGLAGGVVLALTNVFNIATTQKAFKSGNASLVIPIQQVPINVASIIVYFFIFLLAPKTITTIPFLLIAVGLIVLSSWLLAQRQSQLEAIKIEKTEESIK